MELFYQPPRYVPGIHRPPSSPKARASEKTPTSAVLFHRRRRLHRAQRRASQLRHDLSWRPNRATIFFAHAHAVVRESCRIGNRVTLQNGVIIGGDGFGFAKQKRRHLVQNAANWPRRPRRRCGSSGQLLRGSRDHRETRVARGAKLDDLVLVGHASRVALTPCCVARSALLVPRRSARIAFSRPVREFRHLSVGDGSVVYGQAGLPGDLPPRSIVGGSPR